jgi:DNA adenine methylase
MRYPGGKGKTFQHIINLMPAHRVYIETHVGGGAVLRNKRPATRNIALDADPKVVAQWDAGLQNVELLCERAETFLARFPFQGDELAFVDPPYLPSTRRRDKVYRCDYTESDHVQLLTLLKKLPCMVILSGYANPLYDEMLATWRTRTFRAKTHAEVRTETLWFNFEPPALLHDSRYLGDGFRQRQAAKRRMERIKEKFIRMDAVERTAIAQWLHEAFPTNLGSSSP